MIKVLQIISDTNIGGGGRTLSVFVYLLSVGL